MTLRIDTKYAGFISSRVSQFKLKSSSPYLANLRCPICGDSQKNKFKARGYIYTKGVQLNYKCHNCNYGATFGNFLKTIDSALWSSWRVESFKEKGYAPIQKIKKETPIVIKQTSLDVLFPKLSSLSCPHSALTYLSKRKIPQHVLSRLYYCDNSQKLESIDNSFKDMVLDDKPRIIIPAYSKTGSLIGVTCRDITDTSNLRYLALKINKSYPMIFNLDVVDTSKRIYCVEGALDSFFLPNCVAVGSSNLSVISKVIDRKNATLIFDNEPRNREIIRIMEKASRHNFSVCVWSNKVKQKDINDMIQSGMSEIELIDIINKNTFSGLELQLKIKEWKRI
jgi:hypothetical protein|tara:strand:+ start:970 stop:1983 length:1014 start_codon:yes stop_codon:yes gene_type:complete